MNIKRKFRKIAENLSYQSPVADDMTTDEREKMIKEITIALIGAYVMGRIDFGHIPDAGKMVGRK